MDQGALGITVHTVADKLDHHFPAAEWPRASTTHTNEENEKCRESGRKRIKSDAVSLGTVHKTQH